jgi:hypothetical protein
MPRKRFHWTRAKYRKAHHLNRLLIQICNINSLPPLVERYHELWSEWDSRHSCSDPLEVPIARRLADRHPERDGIPF